MQFTRIDLAIMNQIFNLDSNNPIVTVNAISILTVAAVGRVIVLRWLFCRLWCERHNSSDGWFDDILIYFYELKFIPVIFT